jgi:plastocyanin
MRDAFQPMVRSFAAGAWLLAIAGCAPVVPPGDNEVILRNNRFTPSQITIKAGESVRWRNEDTDVHTVTSGDPEDADAGRVFRLPESGLLQPGESETLTFDEPGEFVYFCEIHPEDMRDATVIVEVD